MASEPKKNPKDKFLKLADYKLPLPVDADNDARIEHNRRMLLRALNLRTTVAIVGSGVSRAFGYPGWLEFVCGAVECTERTLPDNDRARSVARQFRQTKAGDLGADDLMYFIGACKELLRDNQKEEAYYKYLNAQFARASQPANPNPFGPLLDLPIKRFITTNYDCEIERALIHKHALPPADFGLDTEKAASNGSPVGEWQRSFTQRATEKLALFALSGVPGNENTVFHCHGRFDDPESVVATEADYQRWYLTNKDGESFAFQRSVELLLGSNPLLFIGYGLRDQDFLRPLRQLIALNPERRGLRPIFALLESSGANDCCQQDLLLSRYGLHVIPYASKGENQRTEALCEALRDLGRQWREVQEEWLRKPKVKKPLAATPRPRPHYDVHSTSSLHPRPPAPVGEILRPGISVLVGPSGSGKSRQALSLLKIAHRGASSLGVQKYEGAFYWNAHYANEAVTGVDYALSYFDPSGTTRGSRYERIQSLLQGNRFLLIIDGCERLLRKSGTNDSGISYSATFHRLLDVFAAPNSRSTVLLAGRLWPADLDGFSTVRRFKARRPTSMEVGKRKPFKDLEEKDVSALCSLLRGHYFGLQLASHYLKKNPDLSALNQRLASRLPDQRLREMFRIVLDDIRLDGMKELDGRGLAAAFLERLGLFISPICKQTLEVCYKQARESIYRKQGRQMDACFPEAELAREAADFHCHLIEAGLLLPVGDPDVSDCRQSEYTVDATARRLLFQPHHGLAAEPLPAFGLSGFTSGRIGVDPDRSRCKEIGELFDRLVSEAERLPVAESCSLCRDAFGLLRTRMEANTVPRWSYYAKYVQFGIRVAKLAKKVSNERFWTYCEHQNGPAFAESLQTPLYAAELAWLYNDSALALSAEGYVVDACAVWEQAHEICRLIEDPELGGGFHQEVLLSLTFTFLEMGRLPAAKKYLEDAERLLLRFPDDDTLARILGLRGLMAHLGGDLQTAGDLYDRALKLLRPGNNLRAQSVFLKHKADALISEGNWSQADLLVRNSRALAEAGVFPELVANARISEGHLRSRRGDLPGARLEYNAVLSEARRIGSRKLEARALTALARVSLDQKDAEGAHTLATQSLSLANELGLGLRQTHSLVVLGLTTLELGQQDLGIAYLREAKKLADIQEYWGRSREAENKLLELGAQW